VEMFYSLYRQRLRNQITLHREYRARGLVVTPIDTNAFFDIERRRYLDEECGFFASTNLNLVRTAFERRNFRFETLEFSLLQRDATAFVSALAAICGSSARPEIGHANQTETDLAEDDLAGLPPETGPDLRAAYRELHALSRLTSDRLDFLRHWPDGRALRGFLGAFDLRRR
jgi:hypothetical protein